MKYVFYNVKIHNFQPKYTEDIVEYVRNSTGSEIEKKDMNWFVCKLDEMVKQINEKKKAKMEVQYFIREDSETRRASGQICIYRNKEREQIIATLFFVEVISKWAEYPAGQLQRFTFEEWDQVKYIIEYKKMKGGEG